MKIKKLELKIKSRVNPAYDKALSHIKSDYFRDISAQLLMIPTFFLLLASWVISFYYFRITDYQVPIKYNSFLGVVDLGRWYEPYQITLFLTLCVLINLILANSIYKKDKFISYVLTATNIFLTLIVIVSIFNFGRIIGF